MKRSRSSLTIIGILGIGLMAASCSSGGADDESADATVESIGATVNSVVTADTTSQSAPTDSTSDQDPAAAPVAVPEALQFTAPAVGGGEIDAASFAGKPTVFWFWAPT